MANALILGVLIRHLDDKAVHGDLVPDVKDDDDRNGKEDDDDIERRAFPLADGTVTALETFEVGALDLSVVDVTVLRDLCRRLLIVDY
jgi:hypothetical protein